MTKTIAIIGGGFSGTLVAVHLLRNSDGAPLNIVLINRSGVFARGVAYGTRTEAHVLNVPAGRMGALPDDENGFLRFMQQRDARIGSGTFVPRRLYGEYLEWLLREAVANKSAAVQFAHRIGHVVDVQPRPAQQMELLFAGGERLCVDCVVLALGNFAPSDPPLAHMNFYRSSARYIRDPWAPHALHGVDLQQPVLLIGTGLTAVDIALDLHERSLRQPMIALSRRGLAPLAHRGLPDHAAAVQLPESLWSQPATARNYLHCVCSHIAAVQSHAIDWRDVIAALRPVTPQLWQRLNDKERARFLRHLQVYWDIHRHRLAPELAQRFTDLIRGGQLQLRAGRLQRLQQNGKQVQVDFLPRGAKQSASLQVGTVINCTGPASNLRRIDEPLLVSLQTQGLMQCDALGLGLVTADNYAVINARGNPSSLLFYVGPLLKARYWEATAVPELRVHAQRAAAAVLASLGK